METSGIEFCLLVSGEHTKLDIPEASTIEKPTEDCWNSNY